MGLSLLVIPSIHFINWKVFLNSPKSDERELVNLAYIVFISFCLRFFLQVITTMLLAAQKPALNNLSGLLSNALSLGIVIFLIHTTKASMFILGTTLSLSPIIILLIFTLYFFKTKFRSVQPELSFIDFGYAKNLFSLGIQFFIIQIAGLVLFSLSNLLITNYFSPTMVTTYNLAYKYFSTVYLIFNMVLTPYWSAYTDAFVKKDFLWIKNATKKLQKMWGAFVIISILMLLISDYFFKLWIKDVVTIPFSLSIAFTLFFIFNSYSAIYIAFINGVSKIRLSIIQSVFEIIIFLPLVYLLLKVIKLDISGIVIASMISPIIAILWMPIQYNRIITNKAKGIWNK